MTHKADQQKRPLHEVSAFVPAFDEAGNIEQVITRLHTALERVARRHEVIVVLYEGCTDGTGDIVRRLQQHDDQLQLVIQPRARKGYGVALRMGIQAARYDYIFYTDADNQFDPEEIDRLVEIIEGCDVATGYRQDRQDPLARRVTAAVYNRLMDLVLGTGLRDVDCAFKLFRRSLFAGLRLTSDTGLIDAEIISRARHAGRRVLEVPVTHFPRAAGEGHFEADTPLALPSPRVVTDILRELYALRRQIRQDAAGEDSMHRL